SISVRSANAMGNSSLSIGWLTFDSTLPVLITIPVTGMFLFRNPLFCRGGESVHHYGHRSRRE
ncbi:hypothetical protein C5Z73_16030, partial [Salmonella enterica subsp. enterica serovar Kentucky]|nr:hypothetical protein [Salmonella enterica subsp. enterica serovar Kentucky]EEF1808198.1 hypothetical protein [Salmonella enterica subsp. enterica serovar Kentucky]EEK5072587.1 hypothetical protein [Salmonella enterica subsp. enterica serovar Kentucky]